MSRTNTILGFWFENIDDLMIIDKKKNPFRKWFLFSRTFDAEIKKLFAADLSNANQGLYDSWTQFPSGSLALILLFDQFSRSIYRHQPQMYQFDDQAVCLSRELIDSRRDLNLKCIERLFAYMPLMHAEDHNIQELSVISFGKLCDDVAKSSKENLPYYESNLKHAQRFKEIISRFGRFPHRNVILNRKSNKDELEFLK